MRSRVLAARGRAVSEARLAVLLLCAAVPIGSTEVAEPADYWTGPINAPVPASLAGATVIQAKALAELLAREHAVIVDSSDAPARPAELAPGAPWLPLPHAAIPGSVWIPDIGRAGIAPETDRFFRERLARATGGNRDHPIVLYCHERCWLSWNAAKRAVSYGYRRVYWFAAGIEGWRAAGFETAVIEAEGPGGS